MMLIAVLLSFSTARGYSPTLQKATSSASVTFFFSKINLRRSHMRYRRLTRSSVYVHLWCYR